MWRALYLKINTRMIKNRIFARFFQTISSFCKKIDIKISLFSIKISLFLNKKSISNNCWGIYSENCANNTSNWSLLYNPPSTFHEKKVKSFLARSHIFLAYPYKIASWETNKKHGTMTHLVKRTKFHSHKIYFDLNNNR